jgi:hypothetical protein
MQSELAAYLLSAVIGGGLVAAGWTVRWVATRVRHDPFADVQR